MTPGAGLVSVVTIFRDAERFLIEALGSVFAQSYARWELLLVDDGSRDRSTAQARGEAARRPTQVRYLEHPGHANLGMAASRNVGIAAARGEFLLFLDSDDVLLPVALAEQVALLRAHPDAAMVCGTSEYWRSWTGLTGKAGRDDLVPLGAGRGRLFDPPALATRCYPLGADPAPCLCSVMVRRRAAERLGGFEAAFPGIYEDQTFLVKAYLSERVLVTDHCWSRYRRHDGSCCAIALRSGAYPAARLRFLEWLERYLEPGRCADRSVSRALTRALAPYRHPLTHALRPVELARAARRAAGTALRAVGLRA